jgi:hypothetical protein
MELRWLQEYEPEYKGWPYNIMAERTGKYVKLGKRYLQYRESSKHTWKDVETENEIYD